MAYLGQLPHTTRTTLSRVVTVAGANTYPISFEQDFLDVFRNGVKLSTNGYTPNSDGKHVTIHDCTVGDKIELVAYVLIYLVGGGGSITQPVFNNMLNVSLDTEGIILDGGTY